MKVCFTSDEQLRLEESFQTSQLLVADVHTYYQSNNSAVFDFPAHYLNWKPPDNYLNQKILIINLDQKTCRLY